MDSSQIKSLLNAVEQLLESGGVKSDSEVEVEKLTSLFLEMYNEFVGEFRPIIETLPSIATAAGKDLAPVLTALVAFLNEINADEDFQAALKETYASRAQMREAAFDAYLSAGFKRKEAIALVLQDIQNTKTTAHNVFSSLPTMNQNNKPSATIVP